MALALLPNNAMTFTENQHGTAVLEKLRSQREHVRCCDVVLHVAGLQFQAHRCVLAACSPYFDSIFKASKTVKEQLTISSQDPEVFKSLLAYMYTGTVVVDTTNVAELLRLANKLLISKLKEHCAEYLERYLDASNCLGVRDIATRYNLEALEKTTATFIRSHLTEVINGEEILHLSHSKLEDFLRCPCWQLQEDQTLLLVTRWVHHCPKTRERNLRSLLTWVQWGCLDPQITTKLIQMHPLYSSSGSPLPLFFLLDALNDNSLLRDELCSLFVKLKAKFCQPTDSLVDNESFLSLAISTAIDGLQDDQVTNNRPQEATPASSDFCSHVNLSLHPPQGFSPDTEKGGISLPLLQPHQNAAEFPVSLRRSCEEQGEEGQQPGYDICHLAQPNMFSHQTSSHNVANHTHVSDDSVEGNNITEKDKFPCNAQEHFGQGNVRNMTGWHGEGLYGNEESQSSDSGHMYQRQVYDQGFNLKLPCSSDSYDTRVNQNSYASRENVLKNKQNFTSAMSYYVSTYNPEDDMTVSDDQSTQSFQYDESFNVGMNFYNCRLMEMKETQHNFMEPLRSQDGYSKAYYPSESSDTQDIANMKEMYYNENSTDTQLSNCPQDMTIQNQQFPQCSKEKQEVLQKEAMLVTEDTSNTCTVQSDSNIPVSLVTDQHHYDHYTCGMENGNTGSGDKFHRDIERPSCESGPVTLSSRDNVIDSTATESKKFNSKNDIDIRNFVFVKEEPGELKDFYKEATRSADLKGENLENSTLEDPSKPPQQDNINFLSSLDATVTSRHVKFKINRAVNINPVGNPVSISYQQHVISGQDIFHSEDIDPDDPEEVMAEEACPSSTKDQEVSLEKKDVIKEFKESLEDKGSTKKNLENIESPVTPKRTSARNKIDNDKGSKGNTNVQRVCNLCKATFTRNRDYFVHMRSHFPGPPHRCDTCDASFKRIYHLLDHLVIHQENKSHKCPHCPFSTHKKFNLKEHMIQHTKAGKHKCKICGDQFGLIQHLRNHETKHTNERPFLCDTCGWSGKTRDSLLIHVKIHTGDLLRCQFPNCKYETPKKSHLKEHMQRHSKSRPCVCTVCGKSFITNSHMKRHMKLHLSEKNFKCFECDYATMRQDHLKIHVWKKHLKKERTKVTTRKKEKKSDATIPDPQPSEEVTNVITAQIECSQADIFSDLENTNVSLQPQLPGTPPPTTLTEYPPSPAYTFQAQSGPEDTLMIVPDMSSVSESFAQLPHTSPLHRNLTTSLSYDESYQSPQYHTSPSHFAALSPTNTPLSYTNSHQQEESPLNFTAYMKYD